jgi:16S rRNA (guanine527-N7)-methyltransferase
MSQKNKSNYSPYKARLAEKGLTGPQTTLGKHETPEVIYELEEANDRLLDIFKNHDFDLVGHPERRKLAHFYRILMQEQKRLNLTRLLKFHEIAIKHFIDSLWILKLTKLQFPLLDLGTGPGFPGVPLKILFPNEKILLAEGVQKRVEYLKRVRDELELKNLDIIGRNINSEFVYPVRGVVTRAVEDISNTLSNVSSCLQVGGKVYFMKGPGVDPEIIAAKEKWSEFFKLTEDYRYDLPKTTQNRSLIVFEKFKETPLADDLVDDDADLDADLEQNEQDKD